MRKNAERTNAADLAIGGIRVCISSLNRCNS
jgi:hypothetical protein